MNLSAILIPLAVGLFGASLGYYLGKLSFNKNTDLAAWKRKYGDLEAELAKYKALKSTVESSNPREPEVDAFNPIIAQHMLGSAIRENDLQVVEGIGPKISEIFTAAGITTWQQLSGMTPEECKTILMNYGSRYKIHNTSTWPKQAELAYKGDWAELKRWQNELDGGLQ
jgi:predicted flap endonuclease-1-like 5' DNA nuclease